MQQGNWFIINVTKVEEWTVTKWSSGSDVMWCERDVVGEVLCRRHHHHSGYMYEYARAAAGAVAVSQQQEGFS